MSNHDGAQSSQTAESPIGHRTSHEHTSNLFQFDDESERACSALVEDYRRGKISKGAALRTVYSTLLKGRTDLSTADEVQVHSACDTYFDMLEEISETNRSNERTGSRQTLPQARADSPQVDIVGENRIISLHKRLREDDDEQNSGKRRPDERLFPSSWKENLDEFIHPEVKLTMQLHSNYCRDLNASRQWVLDCGKAPPFAFSLWKTVLSNSFVDFDKLLSGHYSLTGEEKEIKKLGDFEVYGSFKPTTSISNIGDWGIAWDKYRAAIRFAFPHRERELSKYHEFIMRTFSTSLSTYAMRVIQLDRAIRTFAAEDQSLLLSDLASFSHLQHQYLGAGGKGDVSAFKTSSSKTTSSRARIDETCRKFNRGECSGNCRYNHLCSICESRNHAAVACTRSNRK
jgi:hypothetical protein